MQKEEITLTFERMIETDIPELTKIMTRTFDHDAQTFLSQPRSGPPDYDTGEFLQKWAFKAGGHGWIIFAEGKIAGAFIIFVNPEKDYWLGNIFIDPDHQNHQIGTRTWKFIEATYPDARSWNLETPTWATRNHHFYEKLGFFRIKVEGEDTVYKKKLKE